MGRLDAQDRSVEEAGLRPRAAVVGPLAAYVVLGSCVTLLGWLTDTPRLTDWDDRDIAMFANTATAALCTAIALLLLLCRPTVTSRTAIFTLGGIAALIGSATLVEHVSGADLGIDTLLVVPAWGVRAATSPGRMGPPAATSFALLGVALLLRCRGPRARQAAAIMALVVATIGLIGVIGRLFDADPLYTVPRITGVAPQTASMLLALGLGLAAATPDREPARSLLADGVTGNFARRALLLVIMLPIGLAWLRLHGEQKGLYDTAMGTALLLVSLIVMLCAVLWWGVSTARRRQAQQARAEQSLRDAQGTLSRLLASEQTARAAAEKATQVKDEFLATLSHELRTPLNAIMGWTHLMREQPDDADLVRRSVDIIDRNARLQAVLIADMLDMSRIISGKLRLDVQTVDLRAVIAGVIEAQTPAADARGVRIEAVAKLPVQPVQADPERLQQVVWNLLSNAVKFTPRGGTVTITLRPLGASAEITVADTGEGIDAGFLPHIFERFRQADATASRRHAGLGIGLALVKELVELHSGTVRAESAGRNGGATFTITVPVARVPVVDGTPRSRIEAAVSDGADGPAPDFTGLAALVVDDDPDGLEFVERLLADCGAEVATARSCDQALELVRRRAFDIVISDVGMPERSGYDLMAELRRRDTKIPAVALTAFAHAEDRAKALRAGFHAHVTKPVQRAELFSTIVALTQHGSGSRSVPGASR
jgi:signal transduction histidine kinase/CheY-like chemotaxis protein